ncbi:hypothetical protein TorRG33x02_338090 [Trema orientale]|uniref:Uncharacterized protein n=1 Tax=Trema orientale TaxID=63057 RepID=A0A2P5AXY4_TREOI|nr:hypothetical protein TorRG33x02_338090 [Trema orientale]
MVVLLPRFLASITAVSYLIAWHDGSPFKSRKPTTNMEGFSQSSGFGSAIAPRSSNENPPPTLRLFPLIQNHHSLFRSLNRTSPLIQLISLPLCTSMKAIFSYGNTRSWLESVALA